MRNVKWLKNRLKSMSIPEVIWRLQQKVLQTTEYRKFFAVQKPVTNILLSKKMNELYPNVEKLGINWKNNNLYLFNELDLFGIFDYQKYKMQWNAGFQTENTWPVEDFSYNISISQREDIGDIRTNWELNRHYQLVGLAKNYYITGEEKYYGELTYLFDDWNSNNLFLHGVQWTSAMEIAIRLISWVYMYAFIEKASNGKHKKFLCDLSHGIKVMCNYILKHRARYSSANNHLIIEMVSVGIAGFFFDYDKWINYAIKILTEELPKQNYKDGVNKEMSLHYQCFVMEGYALMSFLMKRNNVIIPPIWENYLMHMSAFVTDCCGDFGEVIEFGDNDEGKIQYILGESSKYYQYVLIMMGVLLKKTFVEFDENIEALNWVVFEEERKEYLIKPRYDRHQVSCYKYGGYSILRSKDKKVLLGIDHAKLGFNKIAAHGHADALSFQLFFEGSPVFIDPGTFNYHFPSKSRNYYRSTTMHNTVSINEKNQSEIWGPFLWGKKAECKLLNVLCDSDKIVIEAEVRYLSYIHTRTIIFDLERSISIKDKINPICNVNVITQNFLCAPNFVLKKKSDFEYILDDGNNTISLSSKSKLDFVEKEEYCSIMYNTEKKTKKISRIINDESELTIHMS